MKGGADANRGDDFPKPTAEFSISSDVQTSSLQQATKTMEAKVTDFSGKWRMKSSDNFEELLKALGEFSEFGAFRLLGTVFG